MIRVMNFVSYIKHSHMFKKNEGYKQCDIFSVANQLSARQIKLWEQSREHRFFYEVFVKINEEIFSCLYSTKKSRPNVSVNQMVGALILKHLNNWTYDQLFSNLNFNILTRHAIGIQRIDESVFSPASIFNFQNKLIEHYNSTGEDLITLVLNQLNKKYINIYGVDTSIQRGDSFLIGSNIVDYTQVRLLVEVIVRFYRTLNKKEQINFSTLFSRYIKVTSSQYVYQLKQEELPREMKALGELYYRLLKKYKRKYKDKETYQMMDRVFKEHYKQESKSNIITKKKVTSGTLMSPDDTEATYRFKAGKYSKGYVGHISETVNKHNQVNLITDAVVKPNNIGDEQILEERLPIMLQNTEGLKEYHVDGAYASQGVDMLAKENGISIFQNNFKGRKSSSGVEIIREKESYKVRCKGGQEIEADIKADKAGKLTRGRASFDYSICKNCQYLEQCKLKEMGGKRSQRRRAYYFGEKQLLISERRTRSKNVPEQKKKLRANVEATVKEMKRGMKNGKVRIRQWRRISNHVILTAIAINFTRIAKNMTQQSCFDHRKNWESYQHRKYTRYSKIEQNTKTSNIAA